MESLALNRDANEKEIVAHGREIGATIIVHDPERRNGKGGEPDLVVGFCGKTILMEIKKPGEELNGKQRKFHADWNGSRIEVVRSCLEFDIAIGLTP
jgi:hypothetical protein